ncbi:putative quinol monooxygenase [Sphingopyxis sp.]|uniref:putative quinol monooxygenase n=1 Tax=Sphingopyxis sp. TaxID=1908224 RepID=UPI003BAD4F6A
MKIIVEAKVDIDPARRTEALDGARQWIDGAQAQPGCLGYFWTADPHDPARIHVFEEWDSPEALSAHLAGSQYRGMLSHISAYGLTNAISRKFAVEREGPVYNDAGLATAAFEVSS